MSEANEDKLLRQIKHRLDEDAENLDGATLSRLNRARHAALEKGSKPKALLSDVLSLAESRPWMLSSTVLALIGMFILVYSLWSHNASLNQPEPSLLEDIELLGGGEELEFYNELEFFQWLEDEAEPN